MLICFRIQCTWKVWFCCQKFKDENVLFEIGSIDGGTAQNAIAPMAKAAIAIPKNQEMNVKTKIKDITNLLKSDYPDFLD